MTPLKKSLSAGAKKDLLIINFVIGLIKTSMSNDDVIKKDNILTKRDNDYKLNKRIDRRLKKLADLLQETQNKVYKKYGSDGELGKWVKSKLNYKMIKLLSTLQANTNLELLANQILFEAFKNRDKPLIDEYKWLVEFDTYSLFDLLVSTKAGSVEGETYEDALMVVKELKC